MSTRRSLGWSLVFGIAACFDPNSGSGPDPDTGTTTGQPTTTASSDPTNPSTGISATMTSNTSTTNPTDPSTTGATSAATEPESTSTTMPTTTDSSSASGESTGPVDTAPPELQFGAFTDSTHITLTFDEPMADVAGVNPGKFRPSLAWWDSDDSIQVYLDLLNDFPDDNCPCITVSNVENDPGDEYSLILTLSAPTTAVTCNNIAYNYLPVMHYDADTLATAQHIRDLADNELIEAEGYFPENPDLSSWDPPADAPFPGFPSGVAVMLSYDQICS